jgi:hypothetical protein
MSLLLVVALGIPSLNTSPMATAQRLGNQRQIATGSEIRSTPNAPGSQLRDDGFGSCPAFTHFHALGANDSLLDGRCHADDDDRVVSDPASTMPADPSPALNR